MNLRQIYEAVKINKARDEAAAKDEAIDALVAKDAKKEPPKNTPAPKVEPKVEPKTEVAKPVEKKEVPKKEVAKPVEKKEVSKPTPKSKPGKDDAEEVKFTKGELMGKHYDALMAKDNLAVKATMIKAKLSHGDSFASTMDKRNRELIAAEKKKAEASK